jgi:hypothetical protein
MQSLFNCGKVFLGGHVLCDVRQHLTKFVECCLLCHDGIVWSEEGKHPPLITSSKPRSSKITRIAM